MERSKNTNISTTSSTVTPTTTSDCPATGMPPMSSLASEKAGVREPSAPKKNSPSPTSTPCSATDTISRMSTLAWANGR